MSNVTTKTIVDDAVLGCCESFGSTENATVEQALEMAMVDAQASSQGWLDFIPRLLKSIQDRLLVVPKASIDTAEILEYIGGLFDRVVGPMQFPWGTGPTIKAAMRKSLLAGVEFIILTVLGK